MERNTKLLILILVLAFVLRVWSLGDIPSGLFTDEASIGVNAYKIFWEGVDEHGVRFPLYFESVGDDKTPLYIYLMSPFVGLFGLSSFNIRLFSVLIGVLTILFCYLLVREMFSEKYALVASLLLAISPWHFHFSRPAFEAILCPFIIVLGLYFLFLAKKKEKFWMFIVSGVIFGLSLYAYPVMKGFVPLLLLGFLVINRDIDKKKIILFLLIVVLLGLPSYLHQGASTRFEMMSIFSQDDSLGLFVKNYFSHFGLSFLVFEGDTNPRHSVLGFGQLYLVSALFLVIGLVLLLKKWNKNSKFLVYWLLIFPIVSSLTYGGVPHAIRSIVGLPVFQIIASIGIIGFVLLFKRYRKYVIALVVLTFLVSSSMFFYSYFFIYPSESAMNWYEGIEELFKETDKIVEDYDEVFLSSRVGFGGVKSYLHFYSKYPGRYTIEANVLDKVDLNKNQLFVVRASDAPVFETANVIRVNGKVVYKFFSTEEIAERVKT